MLASVSVFVYLHSTVLFIVASAIYVSASLVGVVFVVRYINHPNTVLRPSRVSLYTPLFALGFMYVLHQIAGPPLTLGLMITWIIVVAGGVFLLARYLRLYLGEYSPRRSDSHQH